jgi:hypothetical protein
MQESMVETAETSHASEIANDSAQVFPFATRKPKWEARFRWPEWSTIALYAAVLAYAIPFHEPWGDEAQAWQLARNLSLDQLFRTFIRYEASPGLWHFLLWLLIRCHISFSGLHWICGVIAVASTSVLVLHSPFPRYLRLTLPFTFFLLFQYAVVARSYVLAPPLLFLIALWWKRRPIWVAIALGLLANVSLHTAVISGGLAIVFFVGQLRRGGSRIAVAWSRLLPCILIVLAFYTFSIWTAWPAADLATHIALVRANQPPFLVRALASLILPFAGPLLGSLLFWAAIFLTLGTRRRIHYLLPALLFFLFAGFTVSYPWHFGLLVPLLICVLWITWPAPGSVTSRREIAGRGAMFYLVVLQIIWSAYTLRFGHFHAYSPNIATAQMLKPYVKSGATIVVTHFGGSDEGDAGAVGILPYFDHNIFANLPEPFAWWGEKNPTESKFYALLPSHPKVIVVGTQKIGQDNTVDLNGEKSRLLIKDNYRLTNVFCGTIPFKTSPYLTDCYLVFLYKVR